MPDKTKSDQRRVPRYPIHLRVFFPKHGVMGYTIDISKNGCFVGIKSDLGAEGMLEEILIELPMIGVLPALGYVQHVNEGKHGMGIQFARIRFSKEQSSALALFDRFCDIFKDIEILREEYMEMLENNSLSFYEIPNPPDYDDLMKIFSINV